MARAGIPVRHTELLRKIWGAEYGQELEYLRTYVYQLRQKLEDNPTIPRHLLTLPHFGFRFADSESRGMGPDAA
jgi:two-component system KDP operon response regulator KdpE